MGETFNLTPQPIRTTTTLKQPLDQALDVSEFAHISALLSALSLEGTSSPSATVRILTGMQKDTESGWVPLLTFTNITSSNVFEVLHSSNEMLRYIRWEVSAISGTSPALTFSIGGMLRTNG